MKRIPFSWTSIVTGTTQNTKAFNPLLGYAPAGEVGKFRIVFEARAEPAGMSITQGIQAANSDVSPDTATEPAGQTATTADGVTTTAPFDVSGTTAAKQLARPGLFAANTGGNAQIACRVSGWFEYVEKV